MVVALGWMLFHSIWQGVLVWIIAKMLLFCFNKHTKQLQYWIAIGALLSFFLATIFTFVQHFEWQTTTKTPIQQIGYEFLLSREPKLQHYFPVFVGLWLVGIVFLTLKFAYTYIKLYQLRYMAYSLPIWTKKLENWQRHFQLQGRNIQLKFSDQTISPFMMGFLKPVILVPLGLLSQLPPEQIESIILHELAHVSRYDYFVNSIQCVIETLFFFHPCIYWLSNEARKLREIACDEEVLAITHQPFIYASALAALEQYRLNSYAPAVAAADNKHQLLNRIKLMMEKRSDSTYPKGSRLVALTLLGLAFGTVYGISSPSMQAKVPQAIVKAQTAWEKAKPFSKDKIESITNVPIEDAIAYFQSAKAVLPPDTIVGDSVIFNEEKGTVKVFKDGKLLKETNLGAGLSNSDMPHNFPPPPPPPPPPFAPPFAPPFPPKGKPNEMLKLEIRDKEGRSEIFEGKEAAQKMAELEKSPNKDKNWTVFRSWQDGWSSNSQFNVTAPPPPPPPPPFEMGDNPPMSETFAFFSENGFTLPPMPAPPVFSDDADISSKTPEQQRNAAERRREAMEQYRAELGKYKADVDKMRAEIDRRRANGERFAVPPAPPIPPVPPIPPTPPRPPMRGHLDMEDFFVKQGIVQQGENFKFKLNDKGAYLNGKKLPAEIEAEIRESENSNKLTVVKKKKFTMYVTPKSKN